MADALRGPVGDSRFDCAAGSVVGWRDRDVVRATGIRYARAERWAPPVPEPRAARRVAATAWAPACPQPPDPHVERLLGCRPLGDLPFDEHCQRLSVTAPDDTARGGPLPVMVYVHGGAYVYGAGDAPIHDPATLVREQRVVAVTVTYRLGLFGLLGRARGRPANLGLLDQIEALRWVRRNIAAFGGNPDNVTLFGESAGGDAIAHLMIAEGARGLFRRAIIQSPPLGISRGRSAMSAAMAEEAAKLPADAPVDEVLATHERVAGRARRYGRFVSGMPFGTQYGLPPLPAEADVRRTWARVAPGVDVLIGLTDREGALFVSDVPGLRALSAVPVAGPALREAVVSLVTRRVYSTAIAEFAHRHARAGGNAYRYRLRFGRAGPWYADAHTTDMPLLFPHRRAWERSPLLAGLPWDEVERHGRAIRGVWADFARTGRAPTPGLDGLITIRAG